MLQIALYEHAKRLIIKECHLFGASYHTIDNYIIFDL